MYKPAVYILYLFLSGITGLQAASGTSDACKPYQQQPSVSSHENSKTAENIPYGNGLLWKITGKDDTSVYLFGTMHSQDRLVTDIPPPVRLSLVKSRIFVMEVLLDEEANRKFSEAIYFDDDRRLDQMLDDPVYHLLAEIIPDYGVTRDFLPKLKPWAAFTLVGRPRPVNAPTQDIKLMQLAQSANLYITSLESMPELLETLEGIPTADQIEILNDTVCNHSTILKETRRLVELYIAGDLAGIVRMNNAAHHDEAVFDRYIERMLYQRNNRMLEKIESFLETGDAFIAVGASHLPGERGLLNMLSGKGYTIDRVY